MADEGYQGIFYCTDPQSGSVILSSDVVQSASYTRGHGISAGTISVKLLPQEKLDQQEVNCIFEDTEGYSLVLKNCKLKSQILELGPGGYYWNLTLEDRRWKWKFGQVSQKANLYNPNRTIVPSTQTTPYFLATICLDEMGEEDYEAEVLLQFNGKAYPTVEWDYANAAQALEDLCEKVGCRVLYIPGEDIVRIVQLGSGESLAESEDAIANSNTINPPELPSTLASVGAWIEVQLDLPLRAVCANSDGNIDPLDDANYIPYNDGTGWGSSDLKNFSDLSVLTPANIELAKLSVYKWYQIDPTQTVKIQVPNFYYDPNAKGKNKLTAMGTDPDLGELPTKQWIPLESVDQILPLLNTQVECVDQNVFGEDGSVQNFRLPPWVYGSFYLGKLDDEDGPFNNNHTNNVDDFQALGPSLENSNSNLRYIEPFTVDTRLGIVKFSKPVFALDETQASTGALRVPAKLALRISCNVKSPDTLVEQRHQLAIPTGAPYDTPTKYKMHNDLKRQIVVNYNAGSADLTPNNTTDNLVDVNKQAAAYNAAELASYQNLLPQQINYRKFQEIELDGAIRQITISTSTEEGSQIMASRNTDFHPVSVPYEHQRWERKLSHTLRVASLDDLDAELRARRANKDGD